MSLIQPTKDFGNVQNTKELCNGTTPVSSPCAQLKFLVSC